MTTIGWDELNAYVDRELDASAAAVVAAAIARDPSLAARVATLSILKAETAALPAPQDAPAVPPRPLGKRVRRSATPLALAASVVFAVGLGGGLWLMRGQPADPLAATVAAESGWLAGQAPDAQTAAGLRVAAANGAGERVPDLSAADLRLVYLSTDPAADGRRVVFAGYVGPNGCRLGLWIGQREEAFSAPAPRDVGDVRIRAWSHGDRGYALISRTMDVDRLTRLGAVVAELTRPGADRGGDLRTALRDAARNGAACVG